MKIETALHKIQELQKLWGAVEIHGISYTVASKQEQADVIGRIESVVHQCVDAVHRNAKTVAIDKRELNKLLFTLQRWIKYDKTHKEKLFGQKHKFF